MKALLILFGTKLNSEFSELARRANYMDVICNEKAEEFRKAGSKIYREV